MEMSFFAACPLTGGLSVPRKSGHTRKADLTIMKYGGGCPDLRGLPVHYLKGMRQKKTSPCSIKVGIKVGVIC